MASGELARYVAGRGGGGQAVHSDSVVIVVRQMNKVLYNKTNRNGGPTQGNSGNIMDGRQGLQPGVPLCDAESIPRRSVPDMLRTGRRRRRRESALQHVPSAPHPAHEGAGR